MSELVSPASRASFDLSVYLVTDTVTCGGPDGVVQTVRESVAAGATLVQLRDRHLSSAEFIALGRRVAAALAGTGVPLLINDRVELVAEIGAQGAHIGQSDLPVSRAREVLGSEAILGLSAANAAELSPALAAGLDSIDYIGVGALRATATKPEAEPVGLARAEHLVSISPWPVCAIGGVHVEDVGVLAALGCRGVAVVSAICGQPDVAAATAGFVTAWQQARRLQ